MKKLLIAIALLFTATPAFAVETQATIASKVKRILINQAHISSNDIDYVYAAIAASKIYATNAELQAASPAEGVIAYATDSNSLYFRSGSTWLPLMPRTLEWSMTFDEGASKGLTMAAEAAGAAYSTTADALNYITYGYPPIRFIFTTNTTATGTITPAATAVGLDLNGGAPGDNDEWTATFGSIEGTGGPLIPGTTPAWKACATLKIADVSGSDGCYLEVTSTGLHADLSSGDPNYTSYVAIGNVSGAIYVSDNTTGATDTTNTWADAATKALCILGSAAGVVTYTINGSAPVVTDAHTLGDGVPHVMRIQCLNTADVANTVELTSAEFKLQ